MSNSLVCFIFHHQVADLLYLLHVILDAENILIWYETHRYHYTMLSWSKAALRLCVWMLTRGHKYTAAHKRPVILLAHPTNEN